MAFSLNYLSMILLLFELIKHSLFFINKSALCFNWWCGQIFKEKNFNTLSNSDNWNIFAWTSKNQWIVRWKFKTLRINSMYSTYHVMYLLVQYFLVMVIVSLLHRHNIQKLFKQHSNIASATLQVLLPTCLLSIFKYC